MIESINTKVDLKVKATLYAGTTQYGKIIVGDKGFEFLNDQKYRNFIQVPWEEVDYVIASVGFRKRRISRYSIQTKQRGTYAFSSKDPKEVLRMIRQYVDPSHLVRPKSIFDGLRHDFENMSKKKSD
ncbi:DUF956 family protein [Loigolactobacillus backii]|uniref:Uncharacterized protein n=1 Tax=Loigolactobacillus backii TaxID=375175 RepID=A0A192GZ29_9LACO|nr:DUF956 family protein [Loigolactobacillus backii]ANK59041.1 hypothetical protein AYR52_01425 [Loigolactobacillus backii]ANK61288.1 hypothetical protein AYR53_00055 [Loigolactobacillus backii]ANK64029.1 hypothetical protein AYR54_01410 [Loigolactobacillus backii]ANK66478.1 hypothetical protein AYR55_01425 [Loigolactobacillus backii]ANK69512.1 hypothetical protein AYR56_04660 [Loigolactobacillus backii]